MVEYIPCYSALELQQGLLPATRLASRKILIEQNIKKRTAPALCVLCGFWSDQIVSQRIHIIHPTFHTLISWVGGGGGGVYRQGGPKQLTILKKLIKNFF